MAWERELIEMNSSLSSAAATGLVLVLLFWTSAARAEIYAAERPEGGIFFTDTPVTPDCRVIIRDPIPPSPEEKKITWKEAARSEAARKRLDPLLVKAVIQVESGENPAAVSPKGAMGLMQLMPETARAMGVQDPFKPHENVAGGVKYLAAMMDRFGGRLDLALAAYNAGPNAVARYRGIPPYTETRNYVTRVLETYRRLSSGLALDTVYLAMDNPDSVVRRE